VFLLCDKSDELVFVSLGFARFKYSTKLPEATASRIAEHIRRWLVANT
jgi:hypothetical protein